MKYCGVYQIRDEATGKRLVGRSNDIEGRWSTHICELRANAHKNRHLQNVFNAGSVLVFEVLILCDSYDVKIEGKPAPIWWEQHFLDRYVVWDWDFNCDRSAENGCGTGPDNPAWERPGYWTGRRHSEETKRKISEHHADVRGEHHPFYGKKRPEFAQKISGANHPFFGKPSPRRGAKLSAETKLKISEALKGHYGTQHSDARISTYEEEGFEIRLL